MSMDGAGDSLLPQRAANVPASDLINSHGYAPVADNKYIGVSNINMSYDNGPTMGSHIRSNITSRPAPGNFIGPMASSSRGGLTVMRASAQDLTGDTEDGNKPIEATEQKAKIGAYSWFVMMIILLVRIVYQWERTIFSYSYGYTGLGAQAGNAIYEMSTAYPALQKYFGLLTGFAYTIPFAGVGLYWGKVANKVNRKWMIGILMILSAA